MNDLPEPMPFTHNIKPYIPGKPIEELARERNIPPEKIIKLASNENPLGMSPAAAAVLSLDDDSRYPEQFDLLGALSKMHGLPADNFIIGNGSNEIIDIIARTYLGPGRHAVSSEFSFVAYSLSTSLTGAKHTVTPAKEYKCDLDAMLAAICTDTRVVWLANPNNPTGTLVSKERLEAFLKNVPRHVLVVLDEAYYEYLPAELQSGSTRWLAKMENLIILRTFSKIYGLAGLRVGYGMGDPRVIAELNKARMPFNVSSVALRAAAAALTDTEFVKKSFALNMTMRQKLMDGLDLLGVTYLPSYGNFITADFGEGALDVYDKLLSRGVIVRPLQPYHMEHFLRITIGTESEMTTLITALHELL